MTDDIDKLPRLEIDPLGKYSVAYKPEWDCTPVAWYWYGEYWFPWDERLSVSEMFNALLESREKVEVLEAKLAVLKKDRAKALQLEKGE